MKSVRDFIVDAKANELFVIKSRRSSKKIEFTPKAFDDVIECAVLSRINRLSIVMMNFL